MIRYTACDLSIYNMMHRKDNMYDINQEVLPYSVNSIMTYRTVV